MMERVYVVGAGAWGTALAQAAARAGRSVTLVARNKSLADTINTTRRNPDYLGDQLLRDTISVRADYDGLDSADLILLAAPAQTSRGVLNRIGADQLAGKPVVLCAKGFETESMALQSEVLGAVAPDAVPLVLSGPSFAPDVAAGRPTAVTLAGPDNSMTEAVAGSLSSSSFRPYISSDVRGVELAGGLKNVYALACGAVEGAGLGLSARSAVMARAFAEMSRLITNMGGQAATLSGLAGIGDLALSCTSVQSRNYRTGIELGKGLTLEQIATENAVLAEGVKTAPAALHLAEKHGVEVPLIEAVNLLLAGTVHIDSIVAQLMARPLKREGDS